MTKSYTSMKLWRHSQNIVDGNVRSPLDAMKNAWRVIPLVRRPVGRTFYGAGKRLPFHPDDFYPFGTGADSLGISEEWYMNCGRVVTGNKNPEDNGKPFFREGQAHAMDVDGDFVLCQDMVQEDPMFMVGPETMTLSMSWFGEYTVPIYDKHFDPDRVLPFHRHNRKWEYYNFDPLNNRNPPTPGYHTTAIGYYPWVTPTMLLDAMLQFGKGNSMALRRLSPHVLMPLGWGFVTPHGVDHAPTNYCTQEPQRRDDEHVLMEDMCGDRVITFDTAWLAAMEDDYKKQEQTWESLVSRTPWDLVTDPNFVLKHQCRPVLDLKRTGDGDATVTNVIYGRVNGQQMASTKRIVVPPKGRHTLHFPSWSICHLLQGMGNIGDLNVEFIPHARLGECTYDRFFIPYGSAINPSGIEVVNRGDEDLVFKMTFGPDAFPDGDLPEIG